MFTIVLTGGLGAGKSTASAYFRSRGATVVDLDAVAHRMMEPGSDVLARVTDEFGSGVLAADGSLDRAALAEIAFATPEATARLDDIVHPAVIAELERMLRASQDERCVVVEVPLLAENPKIADVCDVVVAITAPEEVRVSRAVARGMDEADAYRRIRRQARDEDRAQLADVVIANDGDHDEFSERLRRFWDERVPVRDPS